MRRLLSLTVGLGMLLATAGTGFALPSMWDVGTAGALAFGDGDTTTGVFDQFGFDSQTSTTQYDTDGSGGVSVGDQFSDTGNMRVNGLIASGIIDEEGLNQIGGYELTAIWTNATGYITSVSNAGGNDTELDVKYTGGTLNFYLDTSLDSAFANPAGSTPPAGAGGTGFGNGTLVFTLEIVDGIGHTFIDFAGGDLDNQGSVDLLLKVTYLLDGFWLTAAGIDVKEFGLLAWHFVTTDMNIDTPTQVPAVGALYTAYSNQNGSALMTIVPEPSTMLLLGGGLVGLVLIGRKKSNNKI